MSARKNVNNFLLFECRKEAYLEAIIYNPCSQPVDRFPRAKNQYQQVMSIECSLGRKMSQNWHGSLRFPIFCAIPRQAPCKLTLTFRRPEVNQ